MNMKFSKNVYYGYIIKGDLLGAIHYVKQFPEQSELYDRFMEVFEHGKSTTYTVDTDLNEILAVYQKYYRDVFYLRIGKKIAEEKLRARLGDFFGIKNQSVELCDMEQNQIAEVFHSKGYHFLGGKTGGYYGPYIWQSTETKSYEVELPDGIQTYTVKLLDGFISKSWMEYLSFGEIGTGGWSDGDGIINCVKSSYDFGSENFKVSLLKHEAQHARDLAMQEDMTSEDLEYRAKLVELIYSKERNMLKQFAQEADSSDKSNGHAVASNRIMEGFARKLNLNCVEAEVLAIEQIQKVALELFKESNNPKGVNEALF